MPKFFSSIGPRAWAALAAGLAFLSLSFVCVDVVGALRAHLQADAAAHAGLQEAARRLRDHLETGREADLRLAAAALAVPLGVAAVHQTLARDGRDAEALRAGLVRARVTPDSLGPVLRLYRVLQGSRPLADTMALRDDTDESARALDRLTQSLRARQAQGQPFGDRDRRTWLRRIDAAMPDPVASAAFADRLDGAARQVRQLFAGLSALIVSALVTLVLMPARRRVPPASRWERAATAGGVGLFEWDMARDALSLDARSLALHGWVGDVDARTLRAAVHPDDQARLREAATHARVTRQPWTERFRVLRPDGQVRHVEVRATLDTTREHCMMGVIRRAPGPAAPAPVDGTGRCELLARISHELRTPLNAVLGFARLIATDQGERLPATQAHRVEQVLQSGTRLLRLVDDVLGLPPSDEQVARPSAAPAPALRGRVLYVEDNPVNVLLVKELLGRWPDVRLIAADDGETGLMMARTEAPDLVLLDMQLPGLGGLDVLRALRDSPDAPPVVVLSANALPAQRDEALAAGAQGYLTKPLAFDQFLKQVRRHLA